jgi:sterol 24-C-methyltransferase
MKVLDVGCGVGGPARNIAKFSGATIVGLNNNDYQVSRATAKSVKRNLDHLCTFQKVSPLLLLTVHYGCFTL